MGSEPLGAWDAEGDRDDPLESHRHGQGRSAVKMEALGEMVRCLSHDFNTPIGVAMTATTHMMSTLHSMMNDVDEKMPGNEPVLRSLSTCVESGDITLRVLRQVVLLIKRYQQLLFETGGLSPQRVNLTAFVSEYHDAMASSLGWTLIAFSSDLRPDLCISTHPSLLHHVLHRIAMSEYGGIPGIAEPVGCISIRIWAGEDSWTIEFEAKSRTMLDGFGGESSTRRSPAAALAWNRAGLEMNTIVAVVEDSLKGNVEGPRSRADGVRLSICFPLCIDGG